MLRNALDQLEIEADYIKSKANQLFSAGHQYDGLLLIEQHKGIRKAIEIVERIQSDS